MNQPKLVRDSTLATCHTFVRELNSQLRDIENKQLRARTAQEKEILHQHYEAVRALIDQVNEQAALIAKLPISFIGEVK